MPDGPLFRSQLVIQMLNNDGSPLEGPDNSLTDDSFNLTEEQAKLHHYALKRAFGEVLGQMTPEATAKMRTAAGG